MSTSDKKARSHLPMRNTKAPGNRLVSIGDGGRVYLETPDGGPDWGVRLIVSLLYPM